jgi:hypothetical protein
MQNQVYLNYAEVKPKLNNEVVNDLRTNYEKDIYCSPSGGCDNRERNNDAKRFSRDWWLGRY